MVKFYLLGFGLMNVFCVSAQFTEDMRSFYGGRATPNPQNPLSRSAKNPTACTGDTSYFPNYGTTAYRGVSVRKGSSLGQYFGANQNITVSGFRFYAYALTTNPPKNYKIRLICNLYKAGVDSLPTGAVLASDTVEVDTVMGSNIFLSRIEREAHFDNPVTLNYGYIIAVESDSTNVGAGVITNSWLASPADGDKKNLGCGSVSGKWYRCMQLNISGVTFDADMQLYPFVKYNLGADFTTVNDCYNFGDTVKFNNLWENNVSSMPYYNFYLNYNLGYYTQRWSYDGSSGMSLMVDGFYKPSTRKNFDVRLISVVFPYSSATCSDTAYTTVYFKPSRPQLKSPLSGCRGDSTILNVSGDAGVVFDWYHATSDTKPFFTGNGYKITNIQQNDTFYVQAVNGPCKSTFLRIDFTVADYPANPTVKNDSICLGAVANLKATSNLGKIEWYTSSSGGVPVFIGTDVQTPKLYADTQFYVQVNNSGCLNKGGRFVVFADVSNNNAPDNPIVQNDTFICLKPSQSITLTASQTGNDTLRWFSESSGGKVLDTGTSYIFTPTIRATEYIYVETWNGVCGSGRSPIKIEVYDYPEIFGLQGDTICKGDSARLFLSVPWGDVLWFENNTDNTVIATGETPVFGGITATRKLYLATEENGCVSPVRDSVEVLVYAPPTPTSIKADAVCAKSNGFMEVLVPNGKVQWYYDITDGTPFSTASRVNAGVLLSKVTYYYETEYKGCTSPRIPLTINIKPRPTAGFTWTLQWQNRLVCTPITTAGLTLSWNWGDGATSNGAPYVHIYSTPGKYTVRMIATSNANGCKDTADIPVIIDHTGFDNPDAGELGVYPIPVTRGGVIHIDAEIREGEKLLMFSADGRLVSELRFATGGVTIPDHIGPGVYYLSSRVSGHQATAGFVISE